MSQIDTSGIKLSDLEQDDPITSAIKKSTAGLQPLGLMADPNIKGGEAPPPGPLPELNGAGALGLDGKPYGADSPMTAPGSDAASAVQALSGGGGSPYDFSRVYGYSSDKFNDPDKHDFKYDTARVMSKYDPKGGFTPELLDELTKLGYGTFSSKGGDKLSLTGAKNAPDAADFADQDWIYASHDPSAAKWMFGGGGAAPQAVGGSGAGGGLVDPNMLGGQMNPALFDSEFFKQLLEQAENTAGPEATDQNALLSLMRS